VIRVRRERELQTERSAHRPDTVLDHAFPADRLIARLKILRSDEISQAIPRLVVNDQGHRAWRIQRKSDGPWSMIGRLRRVEDVGGEKDEFWQ
jgi:hypothetical protein